MVNGNTENSKSIEFTMYLLSFLLEIKKPDDQVHSFNAYCRLSPFLLNSIMK